MVLNKILATFIISYNCTLNIAERLIKAKYVSIKS